MLNAGAYGFGINCITQYLPSYFSPLYINPSFFGLTGKNLCKSLKISRESSSITALLFLSNLSEDKTGYEVKTSGTYPFVDGLEKFSAMGLRLSSAIQIVKGS